MGARRKIRSAAPPEFVEPCLLTLVHKPPAGERWLHEIKHDGYRLMGRIDGGMVQLLTRSGLDWTDRFPRVAAAALTLPVQSAYLDGEVVVQDARGHSDWPALHSCATSGKHCPDAILWAFDILFLDGEDLRELPQIERKAILQGIIPENAQGIHYVDHIEHDGADVFESACRLGLEGVVSKLRDAPYASGRVERWQKAKCLLRDEFVIAGYLPLVRTTNVVGALILGRQEEGGLMRIGKVGTGFTSRHARELGRTLDKVRRPAHPFAHPIGKRDYPNAIWVDPVYAAVVDYRGWSGDGLLRHGAYKGIVEREA